MVMLYCIPLGPAVHATSSLTLFTRRCAMTMCCSLLRSGPRVLLFSSALFGRRRNVFLKPVKNFFRPFVVGDNPLLGDVSSKTSSFWGALVFGVLAMSCSGCLVSVAHNSGDGGIICGEDGGTTCDDDGGGRLSSSGIDGVLDWLEIEFDWLRLYGDVDPSLYLC